MRQERMRVVSQVQLARRIYELVLEGGPAAAMQEPGRFVHLKAGEGNELLLRRPLSICQADTEEERCTIIYRAEGKGTEWLSRRQAGEEIDVLGPLGRGFPVEETPHGGTALLVGGGIGVPPLYGLSRQLRDRGVRCVHVLGFASASDVFYRDEFEALGETWVATADGTLGEAGFVTDVLERRGISFDVLYACGPQPMLQALDRRCQGAKGFLSLEERMACGVGACYACVCRTQEDGAGYRKVCSDGPVFPLGEVIV